MDEIVTQEKERLTRVAGLHPCCYGRNAVADLLEHNFPIDADKGIGEIKEECPVLVGVDIMIRYCTNDDLTTPLHTYPKL